MKIRAGKEYLLGQSCERHSLEEKDIHKVMNKAL